MPSAQLGACPEGATPPNWTRERTRTFAGVVAARRVETRSAAGPRRRVWLSLARCAIGGRLSAAAGTVAAMKKWAVPEHSNSQVRKASKVVGKGQGTLEETAAARDVLSNYRLAHAFPLNTVTVTVKARALAVNSDAVVAQRHKRMPTILDKLKRHPSMSVTTMQDLGGCRVVLESVAEVDELVEVLRESPRSSNPVRRVYDYLRDDPGPRNSGYRGVHLVYEYGASKEEYHGLQIELQVRTQLQHAWATAVETMDLFSGSELKYGKGDPEVLRFFGVLPHGATRRGSPQCRAPTRQWRTCWRSWRGLSTTTTSSGGCGRTSRSWATMRRATGATC